MERAGDHIQINIPNFVQNDPDMIRRFPHNPRGGWPECFLRLVLVVSLPFWGGQSCTRDLPDPGRFVGVAGGGTEQPGIDQPGTDQPTQPGTDQPTQPGTDQPTQPGMDQPTQPGTDQPGQQPEDQPVEIPDQNFRSWVLWNYDSDNDGTLTADEAKAITKIEFSTENVQSLSGIEFFPNLNYLHAQGVLRDEARLGRLTELDLSSNPKLTHIHLIYNNIKTLKFGSHPELEYLDVDYNELTELDVKSFPNLVLLQVSYNKLRSIDVSGLDHLVEFHCDGNPADTISLDNARLKSFRCAGTSARALDLSKCPKINEVDCTECPNLTVIRLAKGQVVGNLRKDDKAKIEYYE